MEDSLQEIVKLQSGLMDRLKVPRLIGPNAWRPEEVTEATVVIAFALEDEVHEFVRELNWKPWKKTRKEVDLHKVHGELIDALHFLMELMIMWGLTADEIRQLYLAKLQENHKRQDNHY